MRPRFLLALILFVALSTSGFICNSDDDDDNGDPTGTSTTTTTIAGANSTTSTATTTVPGSSGSTISSTTTTISSNQPPSISNISGDKTKIVGEPISLTIIGSDPDGDSITYSASGLPSGLGVSGNKIGGSISSAGTYSFSVTPTDEHGLAGNAYGDSVLVEDDIPPPPPPPE